MDWVGYADDLELVFEDTFHLQKGLDTLEEIFKRYNLTINASKTKTMIFNYQYVNNNVLDYPETIAKLNNTPVGNVTKFRYLGDEIKYDEPTTGDAEIELRINAAESKFYELSKKFLNHGIYLKTRVRILNSIVRSRLTYSCQTWNLNTRQIARINSCYTSMLRKMVRGGYKRKTGTEWHFELSNNDIHTICGTKDVNEFTESQQKTYLAHLSRQSNTSLTKQLLFNTNDASKRGPTSTLETTVLKNTNYSRDEFYRKALKREV